MPLVAMDSKTLFSLRSSFFSFIPTLFGASARQHRNTALRFSFFTPVPSVVRVSAQRQNASVSTCVAPGSDRSPKLPLRT